MDIIGWYIYFGILALAGLGSVLHIGHTVFKGTVKRFWVRRQEKLQARLQQLNKLQMEADQELNAAINNLVDLKRLIETIDDRPTSVPIRAGETSTVSPDSDASWEAFKQACLASVPIILREAREASREED